MGVMSCYRSGCDEIMCDTYVPAVGYVCYDCQKEFEDSLKYKDNISENEMLSELIKFMDTYKGTYSESKEITVDEFFKQYTR